MIFIGFTKDRIGYRLFDPVERTVHTSVNVTFDEDLSPALSIDRVGSQACACRLPP